LGGGAGGKADVFDCLLGSPLFECCSQDEAGHRVGTWLGGLAVADRGKQFIWWWSAACGGGRANGAEHAVDGVAERRRWFGEPEPGSPWSAWTHVGCHCLDAPGREGQRVRCRLCPAGQDGEFVGG